MQTVGFSVQRNRLGRADALEQFFQRREVPDVNVCLGLLRSQRLALSLITDPIFNFGKTPI